MKTIKFFNIIITLIVMGCIFTTCKKENDLTDATDHEVTFSIDVSNLKSASVLKNAFDYNLSDAEKIVLTIRNSDGSPTKYNSYKVDIQQMNGIYFTQKLTLEAGNYKLTEFLVLDAADSAIFATPLTGSPEAININNPLPILFSVAKDYTSHILVEVLSTKYKKPEDFGLIHFPIVEVKTFSFLLGVIDKGTGMVLSAKLNAYSGTYSYTQNLDSLLTNVVTLKDGLSMYTLTIEKTGYETYTHAYSIDSIKRFNDTSGNLPMLIELEMADKTAITDCDGNIYHSVTIGAQEWMVENLKTTKYNDCTPIPLENSDVVTPAYCWYNNNEAKYKNPYGALYNWYAVNTGKLCPTGWHVPSIDEWNLLLNYLGSGAGHKLKETGTEHWLYPDTLATNETGFTALPGGLNLGMLGWKGFWWSSTVDYQTYDFMVGDIEDNAEYICMFDSGYITLDFSDYFGHMFKKFSVRCVKD